MIQRMIHTMSHAMSRPAITLLVVSMLAGHLPALTEHAPIILVDCDCKQPSDAMCKVKCGGAHIGSQVGTGSNVTTSTKSADETIKQSNAPAKTSAPANTGQ